MGKPLITLGFQNVTGLSTWATGRPRSGLEMGSTATLTVQKWEGGEGLP